MNPMVRFAALTTDGKAEEHTVHLKDDAAAATVERLVASRFSAGQGFFLRYSESNRKVSHWAPPRSKFVVLYGDAPKSFDATAYHELATDLGSTGIFDLGALQK